MKNGSPARISIESLSVDFDTPCGPQRVLNGVTLGVKPGEIVGLVGESGAGKSVLAMSILQLQPATVCRITGGTIRLLDKDVMQQSDAERRQVRGCKVAMVFQEPSTALNPTIRIGTQIADIILAHRQCTRREALAIARGLLQEVNIGDVDRVLSAYPFTLSGGMCQRVLLAMAFSCSPAVIIADEPTTALDVTTQALILEILGRKARDTDASVLLISHDLGVVGQICDRLYVIYAGEIVEHGETQQVLQHPAHPYTTALLRSLPERNPRKLPIRGIPAATGPSASPEACIFASRCDYRMEQCDRKPPLTSIEGERTHHVACWLNSPGSAGND